MELPTRHSYTRKTMLRGHFSQRSSQWPLPSATVPCPGCQQWQQQTPEMNRTLWWLKDPDATSRNYGSLAQSSQPNSSDKSLQNNHYLFNMEPGTLRGSERCDLWLLLSYFLPVVVTSRYKEFGISHWIPLYIHYIIPDEKHFFPPSLDNKPLLRWKACSE